MQVFVDMVASTINKSDDFFGLIFRSEIEDFDIKRNYAASIPMDGVKDRPARSDTADRICVHSA